MMKKKIFYVSLVYLMSFSPLVGHLSAQNTPASSSAPVLEILEVQDMDIYEVLELISLKTKIKIDAPRIIDGRVTIYLQNVDVRDALRIILDSHSLAYYEDDGVYKVVKEEDFEKRFGYRFSDNIQTRIIPIIHIQPESVIPLLRNIKSPDGRVTYNKNTNSLLITDTPSKIKEMESIIKNHDVLTSELTIKLDYVAPAQVLSVVEPLLTQGLGKININNTDNSLTVVDTEEKITEIGKAIEALDKEKNQFLIDTKILQITLDDEHNDGVDWEAIVSKHKKIEFKTLEGGTKNDYRTLQMGIVSSEDLVILLDALDTVGLVNTTSSKEYEGGEEGEIKVDVIYMEDSTADEGDNRVREEDVGYYLKPKTIVEGEVELRIRPEFTFIDRYNFGRRITAAENISVPFGSSVIIGGLYKNIKAESLWKVPLLGDLPLLGFVFRNQYKHVRKTEIIAIITPASVNGETPSAAK